MGGLGGEKVSLRVVAGFVRVADALLVLFCALLAKWIYLPELGEMSSQYMLVIGVGVLLQVQFFHMAGLYRDDRLGQLDYQITRLATAWVLASFVLVTTAFLAKVSSDYSRGWALLWFGSVLVALTLFHVGMHYQLRQWRESGQLRRNIAIFGAGEHGRRLTRHLNNIRGESIRVVGVFDDRSDRVPHSLEGHPLIGTLDDLLRVARTERIDEVLVALPWSAEDRILEVLKKLRILPVDVRLSSDLIGYRLVRSTFGRDGHMPTVELSDKPLSDWKLFTKDMEDRLLGALILLFIAPVMLLVALLIKLDTPGPVLFRQKRYGFNNQVIEVFKFRTMQVEACQSVSVPQATRDDPRVTAVGRFLRRSSLDELPQLLNVLRGEMSLVGPRPHAVPHNEYFSNVIAEYASRHRVKPGITGWAQVNGWRGETDTLEKMQKRVEFDVYYIDNWSVRFDLLILILTFFVILRGNNAY